MKGKKTALKRIPVPIQGLGEKKKGGNKREGGDCSLCVSWHGTFHASDGLKNPNGGGVARTKERGWGKG